MQKLKILFAFCCFVAAGLLYYQAMYNGWLVAATDVKLHADHSKEYLTGRVERSDTTVNYIHNKEGKHSPALQYCNFPSSNDVLEAREGIPPTSTSILQQVQVVIRHGDRSPMSKTLYKKLHVEPTYCRLNPDQKPKHPLLEDFMKTILVDYGQQRREGHGSAVFPFPNKKICDLASLSQLGVIQHLHNGNILRKAYIDRHHFLSDKLPNNDLSSNIAAVSTVRSRTTQSLTAFLYGLLPDFHLQRVKITHSASDLFRRSGCISSDKMNDNVQKMRKLIYQERQKKNATIRKLADTFGLGDHSGGLVDSFITGFLCKGMKLPCKNEVCSTVEDLDALINEEEYMMRKVAEETAYTNQSMLNIHPLLKKITSEMTLKLDNHTSHDFVIYSGHDTTLKPLIRALGIPDYRWPRLGSRLVFELWYDKSANMHYIRILFNGEDCSSKTKFCTFNGQENNGAKLCPFKNFQSYVDQDILHHFGATSLREACTAI